jgi:hypothetical protein
MPGVSECLAYIPALLFQIFHFSRSFGSYVPTSDSNDSSRENLRLHMANQVRVCHSTLFELLHCVSRDSFQSGPNWSPLLAHFPACTWRFISSYTGLEPSVGNHAPTVIRSLKVLLPRYSQEPGTQKSQSPSSKSANVTSRTSTTRLATERGGVMGW